MAIKEGRVKLAGGLYYFPTRELGEEEIFGTNEESNEDKAIAPPDFKKSIADPLQDLLAGGCPLAALEKGLADEEQGQIRGAGSSSGTALALTDCTEKIMTADLEIKLEKLNYHISKFYEAILKKNGLRWESNPVP